MSGMDVSSNPEGMVLPHERHDRNGESFFELYMPEHVLGFTWSGDVDQPVQVTREPGEQVIATFHIDPVELCGTHTAKGWLVVFRQACERFERLWWNGNN